MQGHHRRAALGTLPSGIYLLKATDANGKVRTYKIVR